uniref:Galectin n=1 Tax=Oryzias sinensis TaxID=183150 RepID=A0A8C7X3P2_9TELE
MYVSSGLFAFPETVVWFCEGRSVRLFCFPPAAAPLPHRLWARRSPAVSIVTQEEYTGEIKGGMRPSMKLVIMGIVNKKPKSIEVTLSSKPEQEEAEADVGLQLKVNFSEKAVQRNACMGGKWGPSENTLSFFPFAPGEAFKVHLKFMIYMWHRGNYCPQSLHRKYVEKSIWIIQICKTLKDEISSI